MKIMRLILPAFILLIVTSTAFPDSSDPKIKMGGGGSCQSFTETSLTQTFDNVMTGTGCSGGVDFTNCIGLEVIEGTCSPTSGDGRTLDLQVVNVDTPFTGALSCELGTGSPLNTAFLSSPTSCTFEDVAAVASITPGSTYSLSFLPCVPATPTCGGAPFPPLIDITLAPTVIPAPEPASMLLLGVGLMGLLAGSKSRGLRKQAG